MVSEDRRLPPEMEPKSIGTRLRLVREAFGLKPSEVSDLLGIERTYWSRFEGGHRKLTNEVAFLIVDRFGVTLDFLFLGRWESLRFDVAEKLRTYKAPSDNNKQPR